MENHKGFSDLYRNSSEELFLKTLTESSIGMPVETMEMLGFKNASHNFRADSEELFKSWLTNGENHGYNSCNIANRPRQTSRRIHTEPSNLSNQQRGSILQKRRSSDILFSENNSWGNEISGNLNQHPIRNPAEIGLQATNLYVSKAWFHSSQPMTRSRSSELRRRYVAMQTSQTTLGSENVHNANGVSKFNQEVANPNCYTDLSVCEIPNELDKFMSPSNSSSSTFNTPELGNPDRVSSVVSMLKGTLERKKLYNQAVKESVDDGTHRLHHAQEYTVDTSFNQAQGNNIHEAPGNFQEISTAQMKDSVLHTVVGSMDLDFKAFINLTNPGPLGAVSEPPSQSESSNGAPVVSSGIDACDGPSNSSQTLSICESSRKQVVNSSSENGSRSKDLRDRIINNSKDDRKKGSLFRYGSVSSACSGDKGDSTKKRRVERSRKMAEAKERNLTPVIPSDMQSVLKRCENYEKEVRSLKLNLSFMNRKDSEQTKQIEELQKQNEELAEVKERLLEEIERLLAEAGKM